MMRLVEKRMKLTCLICLLLFSIAGTTPTQSNPRRGLLTRAETREAEELLAGRGYWTGAVDGVFDPASRSALIAFQKWEGRPVTGALTIDELEAIRVSTGPNARDVGYAHVEVDVDRQVMLIVEAPETVGSPEERLSHPKQLGPHSKVRVLPVSTGSGKPFIEEGQESIAYTPRGRFLVYDKSFGWEKGALGSMYFSNYISGGVAIHGHPNVPNEPASHGCIRIPMFAAREVSRILPLGAIVLVYDKVSFVSAREWVDNPDLRKAAMLESGRPDYKYRIEGASVIKKRRTRVNRAE
jgi:peptidoglycan hydrolase-like protein with peptidoglycan-binding domain